MRARVVRLVDVGLDNAFAESIEFVQSTLKSINAGLYTPAAEIEIVRSRDVLTVGMAFTAPTTVLHVMAHGDYSKHPAFVSSDGRTEFSIDELAEEAAANGRGLRTATVLADGCKTGTGVWKSAFRHCLQGPITYIGTSIAVGWHESTVFSSMFYGSLFRNRGAGVEPMLASMRAATAASHAYEELLTKKCPYKAVTLEPSRWAQENLRVTR